MRVLRYAHVRPEVLLGDVGDGESVTVGDVGEGDVVALGRHPLRHVSLCVHERLWERVSITCPDNVRRRSPVHHTSQLDVVPLPRAHDSLGSSSSSSGSRSSNSSRFSNSNSSNCNKSSRGKFGEDSVLFTFLIRSVCPSSKCKKASKRDVH